MLKLITAFTICLALTSPLQAGNVITFGTNSMVVFPHKQHQTSLGGCTDCHGANEPGPISKFDQNWAHTNCVGCHNESKVGPVECGGCHS